MEPSPWDPEGVEAVLDSQGRLLDVAAADGLDLKVLYKRLIAARALDVRLARVGLPMWASSAGEEAPLVLLAMLAELGDWIYPGPRDVAVALSRGMDPKELVRQILGRPESEVSGRNLPGQVSSTALGIAPPTESLGLHLALAAGHAHGEKLASTGRVTIAICGEGLTTTGLFHESIALAVTCDLPLVFVCKSQLWPDGAPAEAGLLGDSVADRVRATGMWTRRVDGADPIQVRRVLAAALERTRSRRGPAFVETVVTQLRHDPPGHRDPIERLRRMLDARGEWTTTMQDVIEAEARGRFESVFRELESEA